MTGNIQHVDSLRYVNVGTENHSRIIKRVVWIAAACIMALLALRFTLMLQGVNQNHLLANIVYTVSTPFVAPFFAAVGYNPVYDTSSFEYATVAALAVYALVAWGLARLTAPHSL
jgi:hypothetical protein